MNWRSFLFGLAACSAISGCKKNVEKTEAGPSTKQVETVAPSGPDLSKLVTALKNSRTDRLQSAIDIAMQLDAQGDDPIPTLIEGLKDPNSGPLGETSLEKPSSTREAVVLALLKLGPKGKKALTTDGLKLLKEGLKDPKPNVKEHTINALMMAGLEAKPLAEDIATFADSKESAVRSAVYRTLEKLKTPASTSVLKCLVSDDSGIASDAAASLSSNKPVGPDAVPLLIAALKRNAPEENFSADQLRYIKNRAAESVANLGKLAEAAIPELITLIEKTTVEDVERMTRPGRPNDRNSSVSGPVLALRKIGKPAIPSVVKLLKHEQAIVRYQAASVLNGLPIDLQSVEAKELLPEVQSALAAERNLPSGQMYVFEELMRGAIYLGGDPEPLIKILLELLTSDNDAVRFRSVNLFGMLGPKAVSAVPKLLETLKDPEPLIQVAVLNVFRLIGPSAKEAATDVAKLAESSDEKVSRAAVQALRVIGAGHPAAVPTLIKLLKSNDRNIVIEAAQAIGSIGASANAAIDPLVKLLGEENTHTEEKTAILSALSGIGMAAKSAVPSVGKLLLEKDSNLRAAAIACLGEISPYDATVGKFFSDALKDSLPNVRVASLKTLAKHGPKAAESAKEVKALLDSTKIADLRVWCAVSLASMKVDADKNAAIVFEQLKPKMPARPAAIEALVVLGPQAKAGIPDLLEALKDKTPTPKNMISIRQRAVVTCGKLPDLTKTAIAPIADMLNESDQSLVNAAIDSLGAYGPSAIVAVPRLRRIADSDTNLRDAARKALDQIVPSQKQMEPQ